MVRWMCSIALLLIAPAIAQAGQPGKNEPLDRCRDELRTLKGMNDTLEAQMQDMADQLRQAGRSPAAVRSAPPQPLAPGSLSEGGYAQSRWGMSLAQVQERYPKARVEKASGDLLVRRQVADRKARVRFQFKKGRLNAVQVTFEPIAYETVLQLMEEYRRMEELLGLKYGSSQADGPESMGQEDAEPASLSRSVSKGRVHLTTAWNSSLTRIVLSCDGENHKLRLRVNYESMELLVAEQQRLLKDL